MTGKYITGQIMSKYTSKNKSKQVFADFFIQDQSKIHESPN